ncbi:MAG: hypothetical protein JO352_20370 [Chloroflexi bacterium]|nr:hypothetical protein [Chloroflexota bacterium]
MTDDNQIDARLTTLQQQQALLTQALAAALQGQWTGAPPSVEAFLYAIDPNLPGTLILDPPLVAG